jgi:DNA-binding protein HU-beta
VRKPPDGLCASAANLVVLRAPAQSRAQGVHSMANGAPAKPKPVTTRHLAATLSEQHSLTKKQGLQMMEDLIGMITKHLKKGERVKISGLGVLIVRKRAARMGRNPATGEAIKIKASRKVAFRAAKDLKMAI